MDSVAVKINNFCASGSSECSQRGRSITLLIYVGQGEIKVDRKWRKNRFGFAFFSHSISFEWAPSAAYSSNFNSRTIFLFFPPASFKSELVNNIQVEVEAPLSRASQNHENGITCERRVEIQFAERWNPRVSMLPPQGRTLSSHLAPIFQLHRNDKRLRKATAANLIYWITKHKSRSLCWKSCTICAPQWPLSLSLCAAKELRFISPCWESSLLLLSQAFGWGS